MAERSLWSRVCEWLSLFPSSFARSHPCSLDSHSLEEGEPGSVGVGTASCNADDPPNVCLITPVTASAPLA